MDWRARIISDQREITKNEAEALIDNVDFQRNIWTENLSGKPYNNSLFDIILNRKTLSEKEIVEIIFDSMRRKSMI